MVGAESGACSVDALLSFWVENDYAYPNADTEQLAKDIFKLSARKISPGEIDDVKRMLPSEGRALWPSTVK